MAKPRIVDEDVVSTTVVPVVVKKVEGNFFEIEDLPSRYKLYTEGTKISGRPLLVKELKKLATINETNYNRVINEILSEAIRGIEISELYVADKLYLLLWLRANTYKNSDFSFKYKCVECRSENSYNFSVENLEIKYLPDDYELKPLELINTSDKLEFDFPKIKDENRINFFKENFSKNSNKELDDDDLNIASYIRKINDVPVNLQKAYDFIKSLDTNPEDYMNIMSHIAEMDFGVSHEILVPCKKCGEVNHLPLSFRPEFFLPRISS